MCKSGRRACPPEDVGVPYRYEDALLGQFIWMNETLTNVMASIENKELPDLDLDEVPGWYLKHSSEVFDKKKVNQAIAKLYKK